MPPGLRSAIASITPKPKKQQQKSAKIKSVKGVKVLKTVNRIVAGVIQPKPSGSAPSSSNPPIPPKLPDFGGGSGGSPPSGGPSGDGSGSSVNSERSSDSGDPPNLRYPSPLLVLGPEGKGMILDLTFWRKQSTTESEGTVSKIKEVIVKSGNSIFGKLQVRSSLINTSDLQPISSPDGARVESQISHTRRPCRLDFTHITMLNVVTVEFIGQEVWKWQSEQFMNEPVKLWNILHSDVKKFVETKMITISTLATFNNRWLGDGLIVNIVPYTADELSKLDWDVMTCILFYCVFFVISQDELDLLLVKVIDYQFSLIPALSTNMMGAWKQYPQFHLHFSRLIVDLKQRLRFMEYMLQEPIFVSFDSEDDRKPFGLKRLILDKAVEKNFRKIMKHEIAKQQYPDGRDSWLQKGIRPKDAHVFLNGLKEESSELASQISSTLKTHELIGSNCTDSYRQKHNKKPEDELESVPPTSRRDTSRRSATADYPLDRRTAHSADRSKGLRPKNFFVRLKKDGKSRSNIHYMDADTVHAMKIGEYEILELEDGSETHDHLMNMGVRDGPLQSYSKVGDKFDANSIRQEKSMCLLLAHYGKCNRNPCPFNHNAKAVEEGKMAAIRTWTEEIKKPHNKLSFIWTTPSDNTYCTQSESDTEEDKDPTSASERYFAYRGAESE